MSENLIPKPSQEECVAHLRAGVPEDADGKEACMVCGPDSGFRWTDYNGQIYCLRCGATYQIIGGKLKEEYLAKIGLKKEEVAKRYCDVFELIPMIKAYWAEVKKPFPCGWWLGGSPYSSDVHTSSMNWLRDNAARLRPAYEENFHWDKMLAEMAAKT